MARTRLIWLIAFAVVTCICQADIRHLNIKLNKLYRMHGALQNEVDDIWATIITSGIDIQNNSNKTRMDDVYTNAQELLSTMNGTLTTIQELKTVVEKMALSSRNGLRNEKSWHREAKMNLTKHFEDFQTDILEKYQEVKHHLETLDVKTTRTEQSCNEVKVMHDTTNRELNQRISDNGKDYVFFSERFSNMFENLGAKQTKIEMESHELKSKIAEAQEQFETKNRELQQNIQEMQNDNEAMRRDISKFQAAAKATTAIAPFLDSCDREWRSFNGHCYLVVFQRKEWNDASAFCESINSSLIEITTDSELEFVSFQLIGKM